MHRSFLPIAFFLFACGDNIEGGISPDATDDARPATYEFESKFAPGQSSVAFSGQVFRQVLIDSYKAELATWTDEIDGGGTIRTEAEWLEELNFYFRYDKATSLTQPIELELGLPTLQTTWADIAGGASLIEKIAGEDDVTDHRDWDGDGEPEGAIGGFVGWSEGGATSPVELMDYWMGIISQQAADRPLDIPDDPFGNDIEKVYITPAGQDLRQLSQKFLTVAVTFSQAADDYLDSGTGGKGLESSNLQDDDNAYSTLEHTWDEGFGYFGATRDYSQLSASERAVSAVDSSGDGRIDLESEYNTGMSKNAAKRDAGSQAGAETSFASDIIEALITGRHIIWRSAGGELSAADKAELEAQRNIIVDTWAKVFAATSIHYINEVIAEMDKIGDSAANYSFTTHAAVWSELKGFALGFQFNPRSPVSDSDFAMLHTLIGDAPVVTAEVAELAAYRNDLLMARDILRDAYGFAAVNAENW